MIPEPMVPSPARRRHRVKVALVTVVVVFFGVVVAINLFSSSGSSAVDRLEKVLDALPLPPDTRQTGQDANPAASPVTVTRTYQLAMPDDAGPQIVATLRAARYRAVTIVGGEDDPEGFVTAVRKPAVGYVTVLPAGHHGSGGIQLDWDAGVLTVTVDDVAFPRPRSSS